MKRAILLSFFISLFTSTFSQAPEMFSYQAVLRGNDNQVITNQDVSMEISILLGSPTEGKPVYTEIHQINTSEEGVISITIGEGELQEGKFSEIDWNAGPVFLKTETTINDEQRTVISGTTQLQSVPYALHAKTAETITGQEDFPELPEIAATNNSVENQLKNVEDPTDPSDAATKAYVDALENKIKELTVLTEGVTDYDGNRYNVVKIGGNLWMAEDLKTRTYNDGTDIPFIFDDDRWASTTRGAYSYYDDPDMSLYNWHAVETGKLCPDGWHVPSESDWKELEMSLGMSEEDANAFGEERELPLDTVKWFHGFFGVQKNGLRIVNDENNEDGTFLLDDMASFWWTSSTFSLPTLDDSVPYSRSVDNTRYIYKNTLSKNNGLSVRCVKSSE